MAYGFLSYSTTRTPGKSMGRETSNQERWQRGEPFVFAGHVLPALRCPKCQRRVIDTPRALTLHSIVACPYLLSIREDA